MLGTAVVWVLWTVQRAGWSACCSEKERYLLFWRESRLEEIGGGLFLSKLGLVSLALFIGCCVSCFLSECLRKALHAISLQGISAEIS